MKKIEVGPVGLNVARNVRERRKNAGYGYAELSRLLTGVDRPIPPLGLRHIETGRRRVDVDDLVVLAVVLQTSAVELMLPAGPGREPVKGYLVNGMGKPNVSIQAQQIREALTDGDD